MKTIFSSENINLSLVLTLFLFLYFLHVILIPIEFYPDYLVIKERYNYPNKEILYSPHGIFNNLLSMFLMIPQFFTLETMSKNIFSFINLLFLFFVIAYMYIVNLKIINNTINLNYCYFIMTLATPSCLFGITSFSPEASFVILSCLAIINFRMRKNFLVNFFYFILPLTYGYFIDRGNFWVLFFFFTGGYFLFFLRYSLGFKLFYIFLILLMLIFSFYGKNIVYEIGMLINEEKVKGLFSVIQNLNLGEISVFEILKRYVYFWTSILTLPIPDKKYFISFTSIFIYLIIIIRVIFIIFRNHQIKSDIKIFFFKIENQIISIWIFLFPLMMVTVLPTHSYGKYLFCFSYFLVRFINFFIGFKNSCLFFFLLSVMPIFEFIIKKDFIQFIF